MTKEELTEKLVYLKECRTTLRAAYKEVLGGGVKSYSIGGRSLTNLTPDEIMAQMTKIDTQIAETEALISGSGPRRAAGIIPRDF